MGLLLGKSYKILYIVSDSLKMKPFSLILDGDVCVWHDKIPLNGVNRQEGYNLIWWATASDSFPIILILRFGVVTVILERERDEML
jgi:hypothetical protein